jgi:hypothetical protein
MLKIVNILLFLSFIAQIIAVFGMILAHNLFLFNLHKLNGLLLLALVLIHLFLNRKWVIGLIKR